MIPTIDQKYNLKSRLKMVTYKMFKEIDNCRYSSKKNNIIKD